MSMMIHARVGAFSSGELEHTGGWHKEALIRNNGLKGEGYDKNHL
jgi:hypothetical protein